VSVLYPLRMDLSPLIAVVVPVAGVAAATAIGFRKATDRRAPGWVAALMMAAALGAALAIAQVVVQGLCVDSAKLCTNRGDVNLGYWLQSFVFVPVYWLVLSITSRARNGRRG
jgi:uncharacterized membrane protein YhaH (DUF805 family)